MESLDYRCAIWGYLRNVFVVVIDNLESVHLVVVDGSGVIIYIPVTTQLWFLYILPQHHRFESIIVETYINRLAESCQINLILSYNFIMNGWLQIWSSRYASSSN